VPLSEPSIAGHAALSGEISVVKDAYSDSRFNQAVDKSTGFRTRDMITVPIPKHASLDNTDSSEDKNLGVIQVINKLEGSFTKHDLTLLKGFTIIAGSAISTSLHLDRVLSEGSSNRSRQVELFGETTVIPKKDASRRLSQVVGAVRAARKVQHSDDFPESIQEYDSPRADSVKSDSSRSTHFDNLCTTALSSKPIDFEPEAVEAFGYSDPPSDIGASTRSVTSFSSFVSRQSKQASSSSVQPERFPETLGLGDLAREPGSELHNDDLPIKFDQSKLIGHSSEMNSWSFDSLKYSEAELVAMMVHCFEAFDIPNLFLIPLPKLTAFVAQALSKYNKTPFHNAKHASHVFQNCVRMVAVVPTMDQSLSLIDVFALLIAAICHDIDHVGTNNTFHINAWSELSLRYNDISIMEQHHCAVCFKILTAPETDILSCLSYRSRSIVRKLICACILSTDMNNHSKNLRMLQSHAQIPFDKQDLDDRMLLLGTILHTADLCNPALPLVQAKQWEKRISQEFRFQAAQERKFGLPVAPFMERQDQQSRIANQVHFIQTFAVPLWRTAVQIFPQWTPRMLQLRKNSDYFRRLKNVINEKPK